MLSARFNIDFVFSGLTIRSRATRSATGGLAPQEIPLPAGTAGTLTTRTDDDTGVATLAAGHGLQTDDQVDVYWAAGIRFGMTATVAGDAVTIDLGHGDVLPAQSTAVVVTKQVAIDLDFIDIDLVALAVVCDQRAHLQFNEVEGALGADAHTWRELAVGEAWWWVRDTGYNTFFGEGTEEICASNGTATAAATLKIGGLYNSTA